MTTPAIADGIDADPAARGAVYGLLARAFDDPDDRLYAALEEGRLDQELETLCGRTALDVSPPRLGTDDDHDTLAARYNDLFVIGFSRTVDRTDGTVESEGPPVPLYESAYREEVSWTDVNLDLARAYEHFGVEVGGENREHHDHLRLQLEFAGYLCRREAATSADAAAARLDFLDRHLRVLVRGVADRLAGEPGTGVYGDLGGFLDAFTAADVEALAARREGSDE